MYLPITLAMTIFVGDVKDPDIEAANTAPGLGVMAVQSDLLNTTFCMDTHEPLNDSVWSLASESPDGRNDATREFRIMGSILPGGSEAELMQLRELLL